MCLSPPPISSRYVPTELSIKRWTLVAGFLSLRMFGDMRQLLLNVECWLLKRAMVIGVLHVGHASDDERDCYHVVLSLYRNFVVFFVFLKNINALMLKTKKFIGKSRLPKLGAMFREIGTSPTRQS